MCDCLKRRAALLLCFVIAVGCASRIHAQKVDLNGNGTSDVWDLIYGAATVDPDIDSDGDGVINRLEALAGTSPFDAASLPNISMYVRSSTNFSVSLFSALGKQYELKSVADLSGSNWISEVSKVARTGSVVTLSAPADVATKFFKVLISDVDSDGDGLSDWEEYQLGLDPLNANSNGQLDENGQLPNDFAYVIGKLAGENRITLSAPDPTAIQPDPGQIATSLGEITLTRGGFALDSITVNLELGGPGTGFAVEGTDHAFLTRPVTIPAGASSQTVTVVPLANTNLASPVVAMMKLQSGTGYTVGLSSNASVVIYPSDTPLGTGLLGQYYTNASSTYTNARNFNPTNLFLTRVDPGLNFIWGPAVTPNLSNGFYSVRWTGQVQPQYSETYIFNTRTDDGLKLWVNDQLLIDKWQTQGATDWTNAIALQAGTRYNLKLEYLQRGGSGSTRLYWYSPSQAKQIIPSERLYSSASASAPAVVTSPLSAVAFLNQPFTFAVTGANSPSGYAATGLPPGLTFNSNNGLISGTPTLAGEFQVIVSATNSAGSGSSLVKLQVIDTGSALTREIWTNVSGVNISDIPVNTPPQGSQALGTLEGVTDFGDDYAERIRGYITIPTTGNYYFWIAGSDSAELWISNDSEPVNKVRRAYVTPTANPGAPPANGTGSRQWSLQANQKSPWLALVAGQKYYLEVLHKAGSGTNDNWAVSWLQDPTGTNTVPSGIVPSHLLSRYFTPPPAIIPGTLYSANMLAQGTAISTAVGSATLRVSADGSQAVLKYNHSGLTGAVTAKHIHADSYLGKNNQGQIIFDIDAATPNPDGSYTWNIGPSGPLSAADINELIKEGKSYLNVHTAMYPNGEINGHFTFAEGSQTFSPPPPSPIWTDDHTSSNAAARFLIQATYGPSSNEIAAVQSLGYDGWINNQFTLPASSHLSNVLANASADPTTPYPGNLVFNTWWKQSVTAPDQLRQRVAFALSEILVVSEAGVLEDNGRALSAYYDILLNNAFGNFRQLLEEVTLSPAMGLYLDMRRNDKGDMALGTHPNENYAREILQLFSIGLNRMWPDGTLVLNSEGSVIPTYDQDVILGFARVFTGWNYYQANQGNSRLPTDWNPSRNYIQPMVLVPTHHELATKLLLDNVMLPPAQGSQAESASTNYDNYGLQDLELALDSIFNNQNVGPYICRQLIQRLVTSHPSREYLYRVVQKFNDNGSGVRGDLQAVIKAILLDYEARSGTTIVLPTFGKQREPVLRVTAAARAFPSPPNLTGTYSQNNDTNLTITTSVPHRLNNRDDIFCGFTSSAGVPLPSKGYNNVSVTSPTTFTLPAPGVAVATYGQSGTTITVTNTDHGIGLGNPVYLIFVTGGASNGLYSLTLSSNDFFSVSAPDSATRVGSCLFPKLTGGGYVVQNNTNLTVATALAHGLVVSNEVYLSFNQAGSPPDGQYTIVSIPDATHFLVRIPATGNQTQNGITTYPLVAPSLVRTGTVAIQFSTWQMNSTDSGSTASLLQTPLSSPTVFNFFFPDYRFPGLLSSAGLTTPEFQLTSDTAAVLQMNFLQAGTIGGTSANTNGLISFNAANGAIMLDLGPWMTPAFTANTGVPNLVDALNTLLCAGQLSAAAKTNIVNYVANTTNLAYSAPPTGAQMRDRVRAVVHLIVTSPDFTIQK